MRSALAALLLALAAPSAAAAQLAPPSEAPPAAKQVCAGYRAVRTPAGTVARCIAHRTEVLGQAGGAAPRRRSSPGAGSLRGRQGGASSPSPTGRSGPAERAPRSASGPGTPTFRERSGESGDGGGLPVAILVAAAAIAAAALIGAARGPLLRRLAGPRA